VDVEIRYARPEEIPLVQALWFDAEVRSLPGKYERLLLGFVDG
jgi:hypothetical protein